MLDGIPNSPFPKACRRALCLRLKRIHRKIAKGEEEIAETQRPDFRMVLTIDANCFPRRFAG